ncbi:MAG: Trk system potassium transporter TrkA [Lachnospiraceae bacterium]|jgi:trk system potassium uptake protein TrkA|nr:Trk system potassium transporter TrkA [Lachnospiraceae bacterium]
MKIVIIGDGKVGHRLAKRLSDEKYNVALIDYNERKLKDTMNELDVSCFVGDGASAEIQKEADVPGADLVIACAATDELNMLCCLLAKRLGARQTIARVRNPIYYQEMHLFKEDLKLSLAVNPDLVLAGEISRVLIFPSAAKVETFAKGRVELVESTIGESSPMKGISLMEFYRKYQIKMLVCAVQRGSEVYIPDGSFIPQQGDKIHIAASHREIEKFFKFIGAVKNKVRTVMICGGGRVTYYLSKQLLSLGMQVKIIEQNEERCIELCELLPKATIIHGNATDHELLEEEGIGNVNAFVSLTGMDEENIITSMYAKTRNVSKVITKVNEEALQHLVDQLGMESIVSAKNVTANVIMSYVRAMKNSMGSANVETVYQLINGKIEALEFQIREKTNYTGISLKDLTIKEHHLIACIVRKRQIIIPGGNDTLEVGDSVIVVCMSQGIEDLKEILR